MAYIGRGLDKISNVEKLDNLTFDGSSTSYSLLKGGVSFTPSSANNILLSIDGVVQAGNFTVSGSTIDFGTAVSASSTCDFILHYGVGVITTPSDGSVTTAKLGDSAVTTAKLNDASVSLAKLTATGTKDATTFLRGDNTFASAGGTNTPNFWVYRSTNQTVPTSTFTTVQFNAELFDTANAFNTSTYTYTIPSTGKYFFGVQVRKENSRTDRNLVHFKVNGTQKRDFETGSYSNYGCAVGTTIENLSVNDAITIQFYHDRGSNQVIRAGLENSFFYGCKIIE